MTCECLRCDRLDYAQRNDLFLNQGFLKGNRATMQSLHPIGSLNIQIQLYTAGLVALWVYDYFLTLDDEVAEVSSNNYTERSLITSPRSGTHGKLRQLPVRKPSHFSWGALTDSVSAFVLFLLVGTFHSQHIPTLTVVQARYLPALYLVWLAVCKCNLIGVCHMMHANTVGLWPQRRGLRAIHPRYIWSASTCFFREADHYY